MAILEARVVDLPMPRNLVAVVLGLLCLCACVPQTAKAPATPAAAAQPAAEPEPSPKDLWIRRMLSEADRAFADNRLMSPLADNAYDRYRQVLDVDPDNAEAALGIKKIGRRYLMMANEAASNGDLTGARTHIAHARQVDPDYEVIAHMEKYVKSLESQRQYLPKPHAAKGVKAVPQKAAAPLAGSAASKSELATVMQSKGNVRWLDGKALADHNRIMVAALRAVANEAYLANSRFQIIARNDAEGRWIYQTMRDAVTEYRLRANLERGDKPRIILLDLPE